MAAAGAFRQAASTEIYRTAHDAVAQKSHGFGGFCADELLRFFGGRGDVQRRHDLWQLGECPIGRRLLFEDVEPRAADNPFFKRATERRFVDQLAARGVDQSDARLALREAVVVEEMLRLRRGREVQREVVGRRAQLVERHQFDAEPGRDFLRDERIVRDEAHAERTRPLRDFLADASQAGDAERLAAHFGAEEALLFPLAGLHRAVGGRYGPR